MGNNFPKMPRCTDLGPGFLPAFTAACKGGGSRQHTGLPDSMLVGNLSQVHGWLNCWKTPVVGRHWWRQVLGQAERQIDIRQGQTGRQTGRQQPELDTCSMGGAGCPLDFSTNLDAINWICLAPSGGSALMITFREKDDMFSLETLSLKGGRTFSPIPFC